MSREDEISYTPPISLSPFSLTDLAKIIERDSKDSTYKFALLRGTRCPKRHVSGYFELSEAEKTDIWQFVEQAKCFLEENFKPDGFNVGFNSGTAAGQTIFHVHIDVIPRYSGDMEDPTGGVRNVIPGKGKYSS